MVEVSVETKNSKIASEKFEKIEDYENTKIVIYESKTEIKDIINEVLKEYKNSLERLKDA